MTISTWNYFQMNYFSWAEMNSKFWFIHIFQYKIYIINTYLSLKSEMKKATWWFKRKTSVRARISKKACSIKERQLLKIQSPGSLSPQHQRTRVPNTKNTTRVHSPSPTAQLCLNINLQFISILLSRYLNVYSKWSLIFVIDEKKIEN